MKQESWKRLERTLEPHGFYQDKSWQGDSATKWFVCAGSDDAVTACLRFVFKPKMHVLTVHLGWRHKAADAFSVTALENDWPKGFAWLKDAGVISAPCLSLFNLADHMGWVLGGMPVGGPLSAYESAVVRFGQVMGGSGWGQKDSRGVLACYVEDQMPFGWRSCNSAIRLAQVAGLCAALDEDGALFERCAAEHAALIDTDMFGLGSSANWIASLRSRLTRGLRN
jgi:hypothetical protein